MKAHDPHLPGAPTKERISSTTFSTQAAKEAAVNLAVRELRGNATLVPQWRGSIAAQVLGGRIVR